MQWCVTFTTKKIMARITDINELRTEINRLRAVAEQQEQLIRLDVTAIRENLKPMNLLMNTLSALTGVQL
jgi:hypothetical protein